MRARVHHVHSCASRVMCPCVLSCTCAGSRVLPFSRALRFLGSDNQENFFTSTERHQIVSVWLWASDLPALSREQGSRAVDAGRLSRDRGYPPPHGTAGAPLGTPRGPQDPEWTPQLWLAGQTARGTRPGGGGVVVRVLLAGEEGPRARAPAQPQHP